MCIQKVLHMYVISAYSKNVCKSTFVQYLLAYNIQTITSTVATYVVVIAQITIMIVM